ncbi:hypothetical protein GGI43DRAFT_419010 [Trichoderma evansii]
MISRCNQRLVHFGRIPLLALDLLVIHGDPSDNAISKTIDLSPEERVTQLFIWRNQDATEVTRLELETSSYQNFIIGTKAEGDVAVVEETGSGLITAINGTVSNALNSLSFQFSLPARGRGPKVFEFDSPPRPSDILDVTFIEHDYINNGTSDMTWSFTESKKVESMQEWRRSRTEEFSADVSITGGFLGLDIGGSGSWSVSETTEHGRTWTQSHDFSWSTSGVLKPGEKIRVSAKGKFGNFEGWYKHCNFPASCVQSSLRCTFFS